MTEMDRFLKRIEAYPSEYSLTIRMDPRYRVLSEDERGRQLNALLDRLESGDFDKDRPNG